VTIHFTQDAELSLEAVAEFSLANYGARGAQYVRELLDVVNKLERFPHMGQEVEGRTDKMMRVRYERHMVYYQIEAAGHVLVIEVLHEKQLPASHLRS
jgi:plasmid stabilization system protein ParE